MLQRFKVTCTAKNIYRKTNKGVGGGGGGLTPHVNLSFPPNHTGVTSDHERWRRAMAASDREAHRKVEAIS